MRIIEVKLYQFNELSDKAKENALSELRYGDDFDGFWLDEGLESVNAFCREFGIKLVTYRVGAYEPIHFETSATNRNFRGLKLSSVDRDAMPTGYGNDADVRYKFYDEFKRTGDALHAFSEAVRKGFESIRGDMEYQLSDEALVERIMCNEYEFTGDGERH